MSRIIDLTIPARHGDGRFGQENDFAFPYTFEDVGWQGASFRMFAHFGTHVDAPRHFLEDGSTIDEVPVESLIGRGVVFDLSDVEERSEIGEEVLVERDPGLETGDIPILRTDWTDKRWGTDGFLADAPYLSREGAEWLVASGVKAVVYDFPEEYAIRLPGFEGRACEVHHVLLGNQIYNIEYVVNLAALHETFVTVFALPLPLVGLDGAPARVIAVEDRNASGERGPTG